MPLTSDQIAKVQALRDATEEWAAEEKAEIARQVEFLENLDLATGRLHARVTAPVKILAIQELDALFP